MSNYYLFIILFIYLILNKREKNVTLWKKLFFSWPTKKLIKIYKLWFKLYMYKETHGIMFSYFAYQHLLSLNN